MIDLIPIAHVGSTQGKLGALKVYPKDQFESDLQNAEFVFFTINGSKVPFEVNKINTNNEPWLLYLKDFAKPELSSKLSNSDLYLERSLLSAEPVVVEHPMEGFELFSVESKSFGKVIKTEEHPQQILLVVDGPNGIYRIPFHPDLIENLDTETKVIVYTYSSENLEMLT